MLRSVTIKLEDWLIKEGKIVAINEDKSFTAWVSDLIKERLGLERAYKQTAAEAIQLMELAQDYGGKKISREDLYAERTNPTKYKN